MQLIQLRLPLNVKTHQTTKPQPTSMESMIGLHGIGCNSLFQISMFTNCYLLPILVLHGKSGFWLKNSYAFHL